MRTKLLSVSLFVSLLAGGCGHEAAPESTQLALSTPWSMKTAELMTEWAGKVDPSNPLPEYPRPQMARHRWLNLNGIWQFLPVQQRQSTPPAVDGSWGSILVPYPMESAISGVKEHHDHAWYRRTFVVPPEWAGKNVLLNFGAVDWEAEVFINGQSLGVHRGGYDSFSFDISDKLRRNGAAEEVYVRVYDSTDEPGDRQARGKQKAHPGSQDISYTPSSGIWQTVWLEPVGALRVDSLKIVPDVDGGTVKITALAAGTAPPHGVSVAILDAWNVVATAEGQLNSEIVLPIPNAKLWSPSSPFLYSVDIQVNNGATVYDNVTSYFGMRKVHVGLNNGFQRIFLNNQVIFQTGPLDQGFWPDGLYTAPTDEALASDLRWVKALGFNMVRKHIKVEPQRWYYWADRLGLLVWQDMPSASGVENGTADQKAQFETELRAMIKNLRNTTSIINWIPFNEGWGQFDTVRMVSVIRDLDNTRLITPASGGYDEEVGDIKDEHLYPGPACPQSRTRATVDGEYGGLGLVVEGHSFSGLPWSQSPVPDAQTLATRYEDLAIQGALCKTWSGLNALVFTQLTDVEHENSGLLTYDRAVVKPDVARIVAANNAFMSGVASLREALPSRGGGNSWRYFMGNGAASAPGSWQAVDCDDCDGEDWHDGRAGFGTPWTPGAVVGTEWTTNAIWLRQRFTLPALTEQQLASLSYTIHHDETTTIYINGVATERFDGFSSSYGMVPMSEASRQALLPGQSNLIAVECLQTGGGQFIDVGIAELVKGEMSSFSDDFEDGSADYWTSYGGDWSVSGGEYRVGSGDGVKAIASGTYFKNMTYQADVTVGAYGNAGLIFRVTRPLTGRDSYNGYYVGIDAAEDRIELGKATADGTVTGAWTRLTSAPIVINPGTRYHLKVIAYESFIIIYVDDMAVPKIIQSDWTYTEGTVGVRAFLTDAQFDNISITKY